MLTIKFYNKQLDLLGHEATKAVGSRCAHILGSRKLANSLDQSMREAQDTGLSRVEVSIILGEEDDARVQTLSKR